MAIKVRMEWRLEAGAVSLVEELDKHEERSRRKGLQAWLDRFDWRTSKETPGDIWAIVQHQWRVTLHHQNDIWTATINRGPGFATYYSPAYDGPRDVYVDVWLYTLRYDNELQNDEFPVCTGCGGQDFESDEDGVVCKRGCHASMVGTLPSCDRCGEDVYTINATLCDYCQKTAGWQK